MLSLSDKLTKYLSDLKDTALWGGQLEVSPSPSYAGHMISVLSAPAQSTVTRAPNSTTHLSSRLSSTYYRRRIQANQTSVSCVSLLCMLLSNVFFVSVVTTNTYMVWENITIQLYQLPLNMNKIQIFN